MSEVKDMTAEERSVGRIGEGVIPPAVMRFGLYAAAALVIFLAGLIPMWLKASAARSRRGAARTSVEQNAEHARLLGGGRPARCSSMARHKPRILFTKNICLG